MKGVRDLSYLAAALLLAGLSAFAQEPAAGGGQDKPLAPDEAAREQIEKNYRALLDGQDIKVTMEFRNAKVKDVIDEFRRQVRVVNFDLNSKNIPEEFRVEEFIVRNEPWKSAFMAFIQKAELSIDQESPTLMRVSRPPRVTFAFKDADIKTVIDLIARMSGANIIMNTGESTGIKGTLTMSVNNVPWNSVLDTVVKTLNYTTVREKYDIIRIVSPEDLKKQIEHRLFTLVYLTPPPQYRAQIKEGKYMAGAPLKPPKSVDEISKQFQILDLISAVLTRDAGGSKIIGRLMHDPDTNSIMVSDTKVVLDEVERMLKVLDIEPAQVQIDVKYLSSTNDDLLTFGTNYSFGTDEGVTVKTNPNQLDGQTGASLIGKTTKLPFGLGSQFPLTHASQYFLTEYDMQVTFRAFKRDKFSKLLQEPSLSVLDNTAATIFVGEEIPYAESKATATQTGGILFTIGAGAESPVQIGFQLYIVPKIVRDTNRVLITVIPQNQFLSGAGSGVGLIPGFERFLLPGAGVGGANAQVDLPRIANSTLVTRLIVESGRTVVLGGLKTERSSFEDKKIPFLGDLPVIDFLFKQRVDTIHKENLLIFMTPRIQKATGALQDDLRNQVKDHEDRERKALELLKRERAAAEMKMSDDRRMQGASDELQKKKGE